MSERIVDLITRCRDGDQSAWTALVRTHAGLVYAVARRTGLKEDQCEDVAQSVFATLLRRLDTVRDAQALAAWLVTTTKRESWRVARHARRVADLAAAYKPTDPDPSPIEAMEDIESAHRVRVALDELGGKCRELLLAIFSQRDQPDYAGISQRLSIPVGSIGPTRARCLAKLAEILRAGAG